MPTEHPLSDDLVAEILFYLPSKTTTKLKIISSSWHRLISRPGFISLQRSRQPDRAIGFFHCDIRNARNKIFFEAFTNDHSLVTSINIQLGKFKNSVLSSSNGLFLIGPRNTFVWDPITEARISIPTPWGPYASDYPSRMMLGLAASLNNKYSFHIVGVCYFNSEYIFIYSSETRSWTMLSTPLCVYSSELNQMGPTFVRGSMYWLKRSSVLAFDLESRRSRAIKLPRDDMDFKQVVGSYLNFWFGGFEENVYMVFVSVNNMELWRLEEMVCWTKVREAEEEGGWGSPLFFDGRRIAFSSMGEEWKKNQSQIKLYNACCGEWQASMNCRYDNLYHGKHKFFQYYL